MRSTSPYKQIVSGLLGFVIAVQSLFILPEIVFLSANSTDQEFSFFWKLFYSSDVAEAGEESKGETLEPDDKKEEVKSNMQQKLALALALSGNDITLYTIPRINAPHIKILAPPPKIG
ncbi:MAG: hypothetical protein EBU52_22035 [Cytophagia bacterium]|nr:hypothetical protein [Cytophagia bacterium]